MDPCEEKENHKNNVDRKNSFFSMQVELDFNEKKAENVKSVDR
jgi:hypothetical protein